MNRITKIREEIGGKQVDLTFYGRFCSLIEGDRKIILSAIKTGKGMAVVLIKHIERVVKEWI